MKTSEINLTVTLDEAHVPESINWTATDKPDDAPSETKAMALAIWDENLKNTMRMDLWTKEMTTDEMKMFVTDAIGGMAHSLESATNDTVMAGYIKELCSKLVTHIETTKE